MSERTVPTSEFSVLQFSLQGINACIELKYIEKILPLPLLESVPTSAPYLAGLMNYAGMSIPVINLAWRLNLIYQKPYSLEMPILLCANEQHRAGLLVNNIIGILSVTSAQLQKPEKFSSKPLPFLAAISIHENTFLLLDLNRILDSTDFNDQWLDKTVRK